MSFVFFKNVAVEERKCPCSLRLKLKILTYFHRITAASKIFPQNIQVNFPPGNCILKIHFKIFSFFRRFSKVYLVQIQIFV